MRSRWCHKRFSPFTEDMLRGGVLGCSPAAQQPASVPCSRVECCPSALPLPGWEGRLHQQKHHARKLSRAMPPRAVGLVLLPFVGGRAAGAAGPAGCLPVSELARIASVLMCFVPLGHLERPRLWKHNGSARKRGFSPLTPDRWKRCFSGAAGRNPGVQQRRLHSRPPERFLDNLFH